MTRSEASTSLEAANRNERLHTRSGGREERRSCLLCGARIGSRDPTIQVGTALVHMRCAAYRRRLVRR
jgi:hypothetical protein